MDSPAHDRLTSMPDSLLEGFLLLDRTWRVRHANPAAARHARMHRDDMVGRTLPELFPGIESTPIFEALQCCRDQGIPGALERQVRYPDGTEAWFELRVDPVPEGLYILSMDITARKQDEARIAHLNAVLRGIRSVTQLITREKAAPPLVENAARLLVESRGYTGCCIVLGTGGAVVTTAAQGLPEWRSTIRDDVLSGGLPPCMELAERRNHTHLVLHPDPLCAACPAAPLPIRRSVTIAVPLTHGQDRFGVLMVTLPWGVMADVEEVSLIEEMAADLAFALADIETRRRNAEADARYRTLVENLEDVVFSLDDTGRFTYLSSAAGRIGLDPARWMGRPFLELVHPEVLSGHPDLPVAALAGNPTPQELRIVDDAGGVHVVRSATRPLLEDGTPADLIGVLTDLTHHRQTEEQLRAAQKMESMGRLAGGIAHDFNNLLSVILNYTEFAMEGVHPGDPVHADLGEVRDAGRRAAAMTRQLLAFSRRQVLAPRILDLNSVVSGMEGLLRRLIGEDVELLTRLAEEPPLVRVDRNQFEQVILNLAVNARDAMPRGGRLALETSTIVLDEWFTRGRPPLCPGEHAMLLVSDTGDGMTEATRLRVFEPFFTTKAPGHGTGLGLSTVYGIVKQSGGDISVISEPHRGATFQILLPRVQEPADDAPTPQRSPPRGGAGETVLVVEDEEAVRQLLERILVTHGYHVLATRDGTAALATSRTHPGEIHLLLTDVIMPHMSGGELASRLGQERPGLRVLYVSGYPSEAIAPHGVGAHEGALLTKPFSTEELARRVREILDEAP